MRNPFMDDLGPTALGFLSFVAVVIGAFAFLMTALEGTDNTENWQKVNDRCFAYEHKDVRWLYDTHKIERGVYCKTDQ